MCIEAGHKAVCLAAFACILFAYNLSVYGRQELLPAPRRPSFHSTPCGLALWQVAGGHEGQGGKLGKAKGVGWPLYMYVYLLFVFIDFQVKTLLRSANCPMCAWHALTHTAYTL